MRIPSKRFWIQEGLFTLLYFLVAISIDYAVGEEDQSQVSYYVKEAIKAIIFAFITALLMAPENPFNKKGHRSSNLS